VRLRAVGTKVYVNHHFTKKCQIPTHCQNVSGSLSRKHSAPNPNLNDETDHLARCPMSGHGSGPGLLAVNPLDHEAYNNKLTNLPEETSTVCRPGPSSVSISAPSPLTLEIDIANADIT
jgi:hypothetical protein